MMTPPNRAIYDQLIEKDWRAVAEQQHGPWLEVAVRLPPVPEGKCLAIPLPAQCYLDSGSMHIGQDADVGLETIRKDNVTVLDYHPPKKHRMSNQMARYRRDGAGNAFINMPAGEHEEWDAVEVPRVRLHLCAHVKYVFDYNSFASKLELVPIECLHGAVLPFHVQAMYGEQMQCVISYAHLLPAGAVLRFRYKYGPPRWSSSYEQSGIFFLDPGTTPDDTEVPLNELDRWPVLVNGAMRMLQIRCSRPQVCVDVQEVPGTRRPASCITSWDSCCVWVAPDPDAADE